jgi:hypothetical protein
MIDIAGRTGDFRSRLYPAKEHFSGITDPPAVDAVQKAVRERIASEFRPEIPRTSQYLAVPVYLRLFP